MEHSAWQIDRSTKNETHKFTQTVKSLKFWRRWTSLSISEIFTRLRACFSILNRSKALHSIETTFIWELHKRRFSWSFNFFPASAALHRIKRARSKTAIDLASARCRDRSSGSLVCQSLTLHLQKSPLYPTLSKSFPNPADSQASFQATQFRSTGCTLRFAFLTESWQMHVSVLES